MNATTGTDTTGIYSSLSTSGAYGTSVGSGTGTPAVGTSNDASMRSGYLNSSAASDANGIRNLSYNATSSTDFAIRTNDVGHNVSSTSNWGWLGLIGLMGLLGSRRKVTDR
ncbi:WGxxGxxG-CTERM domain-containing protein [Paenibacillus sp. GCM10023248]|uniref:WGxxGxxG-CTERM domain-containing protein n=1 Tax=Bacillales TaxID=1385 RepID=UPI0023783230|nr:MULTISPECIES: WGxxGxxG-CTERM domain-containing protein [Bacillales]MDD9267153.1 WGxxGxxG-CTERM domain-containing protein [Paenibacillus sp. MAHUQ-63]MDR6881375.1 MYXO-CTERM domain-containing protein [Bacillus sp. 3255]